jgi:hypothetical protein
VVLRMREQLRDTQVQVAEVLGALRAVARRGNGCR